MELQTIILTNRCIKRPTSKGHSLFGKNRKGKNKPPYRMAIAKQANKRKCGYELDVVAVGDEASQFAEQASKYQNGRPWVLFLHGNNQSLKKNLKKCEEIQDIYNVNFILYSWPSRSEPDGLWFNAALTVGAIIFKPESAAKQFAKTLIKK